MENIQDIYNALKSFSNSADSMQNTFMSMAKSIGFISIVLIWGVDIAKALGSGVPINFTKYLYPIALSFLLGSYSLISKTLENTSKGMEKKIESANGGGMDKQWERIWMSEEEQYKAISETKISEYEKMSGKKFSAEVAATDPNAASAVQAVEKYENSQKSWIESFFSETINPMFYINKFLKFLSYVIGLTGYYALALISKFRLIILGVIGPLSIGISIIPAYSNSAANFFHKSITYMLWIPLASLVNAAVSSALAQVNPSLTANAGLIMGIAIFQIILYLQIPKVAHEVMMIGGARESSGMGQAVTNTAVSAATKGLK